ncbi:SGNH/GDSL hydrolase family protein [Peterkaempfera bronchialis]|uniref:triacylglycerol lipase n=1 Tax=Peterkaempfera bronchialis TaxID=2126346 RepID=A0A345T3I0_9ACTN|nr:SGNH/GDSL hydrolase family protein [Peterkaempfera bronchialis]AXI80535.1 SGNH/GDSL hydrolase family protein [Peterkaempfera bronchialis]
MRPSRVASAVLAALVLSLATLFTAPTAVAAGGQYVALGDSYSAGVGAGSYLSSSGSCYRSTKSYPYLWNASHSPSSFSFVACSGATTADVLGSQLSALSSSTTLVSLSVGGNDAGFADVMTTCVLNSESTCLSAVSSARSYITGTLPGKLDSVYAAIRAKAPNARVVVLGYPHMYKIGGSCIIGIGDTKRSAINAAADDLATVTAKRAADAGFTFVDVRGVFTNHEICSGSSWLNSTTLPIYESYHPNSSGQASGYLPSFSGAA